MENGDRIVFYDGDCGFCNHSVQFILKRNKKSPLLYFAALQSDFTKNFFTKLNEPLPDISSLVFFEENKFYYRSEGAMRIAKYLKGYRWLSYFRFIPRFIRDTVYSIIAKQRHRLGNHSQCELISLEDKSRFLD